MRWNRRFVISAGAIIAAAPTSARAANVALEAPVAAPSRLPNESYSVIQALLEARGHTVTIVDGTEIDTIDEIQQFDTVVLSGSGYATGHDCALFDAIIADYVEQGGGLVVTGWFYYYNNYLNAPNLMEVTPFEPSTNFIQNNVVTITDGHEIVDGLSDWNNPSFDSNNGPIDMGAIELSRANGVIDAAVMEYGAGRVASLGPLFTAEYQAYTIQALHDGSIPDATEMFMRAIEWTATQQAPEGCHDGDLDPGEECDDGNFSNSDACVNPCVFASCGDGYTQVGVEPCDDGDMDNTDACLVGCIAPTCGDGYTRVGVEDCDDANGINTDACLDDCSAASCGDGYLYAGVETCDDGNLSNSDECPGSCQPAVCGDGYVLAGVEPCDDGNMVNTDDCLVGCILPSCGDGFLQNGVEACDDANDDNTDTCVGATCSLASCGDGFVFAGFEECDDGNAEPGDGCTACQLDSSETSSEGGEGESSSEGGEGESSSEGGSTGDVDSTGGDGGDTTGDSGSPSTTADDTGGTTTNSSDDTTGTGIDPTAAGDSESTGAAAADDELGGCGCASDDPGARGLWMLAGLIGFGLRPRRRFTRR
jgi:MYXO-CTERM domain-containing protein